MKAPKFELIGEVTSYTPKGTSGKVVEMKMQCEFDGKSESIFKTFPITLFGDHGQEAVVKAPIGSKIAIDCYLDSFISDKGSVFVSIKGNNYKVISLPKAPEPELACPF